MFKKEIIILLIQLIMFYIYPIYAGPIDPIAMILIIIMSVFILSTILGIISKQKIKYLYPVIISILFIPSVFIYYNESAMIHALWYFVVSAVGLIIGIFTSKIKHMF